VEFLGHEVTAAGAKPLRSHVEAIEKFPLPHTFKQLQAFLGLVNFYRRFIPCAAQFLCPLTNVLRGGQKGSTPVTWSASMRSAFQTAKAAIAEAAFLVHPSLDSNLSLVVDASATHVGAALQQCAAGKSSWQPLGFFSRKLD
jgi:hypothetical protein